jgi:Putative Ig domain
MNAGTRTLAALVVAALVLLIACGGGGSSSNSFPPPPPQTQPLVITTTSILPGTLQAHSYSATLTATGGQAPYHWSIGDIDQSHPMNISGLSFDANTGVISGTPTFVGIGGFLATVTDSSSPAQTAIKGFTFQVSTPLVVPGTQNVGVQQFNQSWITLTGVSGGVSPFNYLFDPACSPPGMKSHVTTPANNNSTVFTMDGTPFTTGTYTCRITIQDSYTPPEVGTMLMTIVVTPPPLSAPSHSLPTRLLLNRPFSGRIVAVGGVQPYSFALMTAGSLPTGLALDVNSGQVSGTPTILGFFDSTVQITDSSTPPQKVNAYAGITIASPLGRNDSPATAIAISNGTFSASISPYIDPPNGTPAPGDNDYYKLVSLGGATVHVETSAKRANPGNPLDTVIEIVDGNGRQFNTCRQPGDTSTNFSSPCINDDISSTVLDSALDFQVQGATNVGNTFYVHLLDWRGDARPDMSYQLSVSGIIDPLTIDPTPLLPGARSLTYGWGFNASHGTSPYTWSIVGGQAPSGLTLASQGTMDGVPTTDGTFVFTVQVTDSANPPQTATAQESLLIVEPLTITSPANFPNACVNQPYSFAVQTSGGAPPLTQLMAFPTNIGLAFDNSTGVLSGTLTVTGTFSGTLYVKDQTQRQISQSVTLSVVTCP